MSNYSKFDLDQAEKLINNGFDGSGTNKESLKRASVLLARASSDFSIFAIKTFEFLSVYDYLMAQSIKWQELVNKVNNMPIW
jgi:hypothetical protein